MNEVDRVARGYIWPPVLDGLYGVWTHPKWWERWEHLTESAERHRAFYEAVPEHLRGHPLIAEMSAALDQPVHPAYADQLRRRYEELLDGG